MKRLMDHLYAHPVRLLITLLAPLIMTSILAVIAVSITVDANKNRDEAVCRQVNNLRETIYVAIIDFGGDLTAAQRIVLANRFLPFQDCEDIH